MDKVNAFDRNIRVNLQKENDVYSDCQIANVAIWQCGNLVLNDSSFIFKSEAGIPRQQC